MAKAPKSIPGGQVGGISVSPPFEKGAESATEFFHASLRAVALETYTRIAMRTPVRTGRARGNWHITINQPSDEEMERKATSGPPGSEYNKLSKATVVNFPDIYIQNALPYILELEYGHSQQQAPQGMVRLTLAEISSMGGA